MSSALFRVTASLLGHVLQRSKQIDFFFGKHAMDKCEVATGKMTCGVLIGRAHHVRPIFFGPAGFSRNSLWSRIL